MKTVEFVSFSREQLIEPCSSYHFLFDCFQNMAIFVGMQILGYGIMNIKYDVDMAMTLVIRLESQECSYSLTTNKLK